MKLNTSGPQAGSFGIPPQVAEAHARARQEADDKRKKQAAPEAPQSDFTEELPSLAGNGSTPPPPAPEDQKAEDTHPVKLLEKLGATFTDEDFQRLLFKGYYEKELVVVNHPKEELRLRALFRTLTGDEYDEADEILAEEIKSIEMTNDGYLARRSMLILAYGVTQLNGRPIVKGVMKGKDKDKTLDTRATALERRKVLGQLSPAVSNMLVRKHGAITMAINMIVEKPEEFLKNS